MTKKIAILYAGARNWGGVETYIKQIFENTNSKKLDLCLISLGGWELNKLLAEKGYKVAVIKGSWYEISKYKKIARILTDNNIDLITSQGLVANFYARLAANKTKIPNLVTIHSDYKFDYRGLRRILYWITFRIMESMTSRYIVVSNFLKIETRKIGVDDAKITLVYNGVAEIKPQPKNEGRMIVFGSLGRLHYKKGYQCLIEATKLLHDRDFVVRVWGEGEERENLEALIRENKLQNKFILEGFASDISKALSQVDIYIQPSLEEGFGITVAEAMYAEKPVIVTPAGSLPELVKDGETGIVAGGVNPGAIAAAMRLALDKHNQLGKMAKMGRIEALRKFGLDKWATQIEKIYFETAK